MTVVGRGARVEGTLVSTESIRIDGQVKGKIAARCDVILSSNSHVEADIRAQNVVSGGTLKGTITARTRTEVAQGGRVEGKIRSKELVVRRELFSAGGIASRRLGRRTGLRFQTSCGRLGNRYAEPPSGAVGSWTEGGPDPAAKVGRPGMSGKRPPIGATAPLPRLTPSASTDRGGET
jgi:cytoskeletal protein CcmA (bactofilin family)